MRMRSLITSKTTAKREETRTRLGFDSTVTTKKRKKTRDKQRKKGYTQQENHEKLIADLKDS
jgi:hypothetical protein